MPSTDTPLVDVVVATHHARRPIERAVGSVLDRDDAVRVTVVCHGVDAAPIRERLRGHEGARLRVVEFHDGIRSPAGPFNHGLRLADAPYVAILGSDDRFDPGAATAWARLAQRHAATVVIAPVRGPDGVIIKSPLVRRGRTHDLDPVRDRLVGRNAPLGAIETRWVHDHAPFMVEGLPTGEDVNPSHELWFTAPSIVYVPTAPAYDVGYDGDDRVTSVVVPVRAALEAIRDLRGRNWFERLSRSARRAIATKVLRQNVLSGVAGVRRGAGDWSDDDLVALREEALVWLKLAPGCERVLCRADRDLLDSVISLASDVDTVAAAVARWHAETSRIRRAFPRNLARSLQRDALPRIVIDLARAR